MPAPRLLKNALFRSSDGEGGDKQVPEPAAKRAVDRGESTVRSRAEKSVFKRIHVGRHVLDGTWRMRAGWPLGRSGKQLAEEQQRQGLRASKGGARRRYL